MVRSMQQIAHESVGLGFTPPLMCADKYPVDISDLIDLHGNLSISLIMGRQRRPSTDPRYVPPEVAERLVYARIKQMEMEVEESLARLEEIERFRG